MSAYFEAMLANGMVVMGFYFLWWPLAIIAFVLSAITLGLSLKGRNRRAARLLSAFGVTASLAPFAAILLYSEELSRYAPGESPIYFCLSLLPLVLSIIAARRSRKPPTGTQQD